MDPIKLAEILDLHKKWLKGDADGRRANLYGANLTSADLYGANLTSANLTRISLPVAQLPEGTLQVYKKLRHGVIVTLEIPKDAKRSSATTNKCRAEYAIPIAFSNNAKEGWSLHDATFRYSLGKTIKPDRFDECRWNECAPGIHFFLTRQEAEEYNG